jgi:hypothetical protein
MEAAVPNSVDHAALDQAVQALEQGDAAAAEAAMARACPELGGAALLRDPARLDQLAKELNADLAWSSALLVHRLKVAAGHLGYGDLRPWLAWRVANQPIFHQMFEDAAPLARLRTHLEAQLGQRIASMRTERMRPGLIAMAIFRHHVTLEGSGREVAIVEKVLSTEAYDVRRVEHEDLLFTKMPAAALMATPYYGMKQDGPFASSFHEFFAGEPLDLSRWVLTNAELLYRYWSIVPPEALRRGPKIAPVYYDNLFRLQQGEVPPQVAAHLHVLTPEEVARLINERRESIDAKIAAMPRFVFHDDLHCGNILVDPRGAMAIIDWDNWAMAPLGTGWHFHAEEDWIEEIQLERVTWARPLPPGMGVRELMLMASLWGWHKALREAKWLLAARWLEKILRYSEPG